MSKKRRPETGARPGTLILNSNACPVQMRAAVVVNGQYVLGPCESVEELPRVTSPDSFVWIDVQGVGDGTVLKELASRFRISPLAMEDLVNASHRPKLELFEHQGLIIAHSVPAGHQTKTPCQLGIIFDDQYVLTFHQSCDHVLAPIRRRMENPDARLRRQGTDYLVYAILDACVDGCYPLLEHLGEQIESLETEALNQPSPEILSQIHVLKNVLIQIRRSIWPQREMVLSLLNTDTRFVSAMTKEYLRDTADHTMHLADTVDTYRESTSALVSTYMSAVAHRSNEIMKVLTLLTSVFVPPTFLAGVYGMNFSRMPELELEIAYPVVLGMMLMMIAGTVYYFYRRGWLTGASITIGNVQKPIQPTVLQAEQHRVVMEAEHEPELKRAA
jgi:magnesium transporter